jgi:hypothetical protein
MSRKFTFLLCFVGFLVLTTCITLLAQSPAYAQCGDPPPKSSCITCHEKEDPVYQNGEWHGIHALKDCCTNCHGGNCRMMDKTLAHEGLVAHPLDDIYTNCYYCHPYDYQERAARFGAVLGVIPGSRQTPTPVPTGPVVVHTIVILPTSIPNAMAVFPWHMVMGGIGLFVAILAGLGILFYRLRAQIQTNHQS